MNKKNYSLIPLLSVIALLAMVSFVRAEDDENENVTSSSSTSTSSSTPKTTTKTITQTIVLEPARTVTTTIMKDVALPDSDRDGIPDEQDLYPNIPQQFIVNDSNFDGIDDRYEIQDSQI